MALKEYLTLRVLRPKLKDINEFSVDKSLIKRADEILKDYNAFGLLCVACRNAETRSRNSEHCCLKGRGVEVRLFVTLA
jgi:hypothetical protein